MAGVLCQFPRPPLRFYILRHRNVEIFETYECRSTYPFQNLACGARSWRSFRSLSTDVVLDGKVPRKVPQGIAELYIACLSEELRQVIPGGSLIGLARRWALDFSIAVSP